MSSRAQEPVRGTRLLRVAHRQAALRLLRVDGPLARTDLAQRLELAPSAVTAIVGELLEEGLLVELPATDTAARRRGRPRVLVGCNPHSARVVGAQVGAHDTRVVLADAAGSVLDRRQASVEGGSPAEALDVVVREARDLLATSSGGPLAAVGVCLPASVDVASGTVLRSDHLGWGEVAVAELVAEQLGVPVLVQDVTQAATLAEALEGAAVGARNVVVLDHGGRIGVGLIVDGELYRGSTGLAGGVGHVSITGAMARCRCGRIGCLEAVATSNAMLAAVGEPGLSFVDLAERARVEDGSARRAVDAALDQLAHAAAMVVGLLDPEVLVLTGFAVHYAEAGRHLERTLPGLLPPERVGRTEIRVSTLGPEAWVRGSVLVALQELQPSVGRLLRGV